MKAPGTLGKAAVVVSLAAVAIAAGACSGDGDGSEEQSRSASVGQTVTPIKKVSCSAKSGTQRYFGELWASVTKASSKKLWLMSSDVDCGRWSGRSNPTKLAKVGPYESGLRYAPGVTNPFRLEVTSGSRAQWRMRMVTKAADGTFKELYSFKLTFAQFPKKGGYWGLFLCPNGNCNDVSRVKECPSFDPKNIDCGFPPENPYPRGRDGGWAMRGVVYRTPAFGGFKPFVIETWTSDNPSKGEGGFQIEIRENPTLG